MWGYGIAAIFILMSIGAMWQKIKDDRRRNAKV